jgi:hypothetical protein
MQFSNAALGHVFSLRHYIDQKSGLLASRMAALQS